jgi:glycerophosphoryl diester phosphodiesterase
LSASFNDRVTPMTHFDKIKEVYSLSKQSNFKDMNRREFLKAGGIGTVALTVGTTGIFSLGSMEALADSKGTTENSKKARGHAVVVGHRGSPLLAPEETIASYKRALAEKTEVLEGDVQLTADGELVLVHDDTLVRTTDVMKVFPDRAPWMVGDFTLDEIKQLDAGSWFDPRFAGERIPTVRELLETNRGKAGLTLELKSPQNSPGVGAKLAEELIAAGLADGGQLRTGAYKVMVHSRDEAALKEFHEVATKVQLAVLTGGEMLDDSTLKSLSSWTIGVFAHPRKTNASDIERAHKHGLIVFSDPVDSPQQIEMALNQNYDWVITNQPATALRVRAGRDPFQHENGVVIDHVFPNPSGDDIQPETGEHVTLRNTTNKAINVSSHYLRDQSGSIMRIGEGYVIEPGSLLRIYVGPGTNRPGAYYNAFTTGFLGNTNGDTVTYFSNDHTILDIYSYIVP